MTQCLDDATLEALAHGRRDLVPEGALEHARGCARCAAELEDARALSTAFGAHLPDPAVLDEAELSALVSRALDTGQRDSQAARARLLLSTLACALAAGALGVSSIALSWPRANELLTAARDGLAVASAFRRVLALLPEETSFVAFGLALVVLAAGALWARANARRASSGAAAIASLVVLSAGLSYASDAFALDLRGSWDDAPRVSVELERRSRSEALQAVARAASLDLVASLPDEGPPVEVHVRNAPLADVLRAILGDGPFVVERTGSLLVVRVAEPSEPGADAGSVTALPRGGAAGDPGTEPTPTPSSDPMPDAGTPQDVAGSASGAPTSTTAATAVPSAPSIVPLPALPPIPPMPTLPGAGTPPAPVPAWVGDRIARGGDVLVRAGERVRDAVALGGDVRVEGEVTGDAVATGGDVRVVSGGNVFGDATSMGGDVVVESGGTVGGSTVSVGGEVRLEPGAAAHGSSYRTDRPGVQLFRGDVDSAGTTRWLSDALGRGARYALLLLLALVLAGAAPDRFAALQRTLVKQPARAVASGVLGALGAAIAMLVLAVTIIGLPAAIVVALLVVACVYVGLAASASVIGAIVPIAKLRDRPVLQTATGVALLFVVSFVPFVGGLVVAFAALIGGGAVVATRFSTRAPGD